MLEIRPTIKWDKGKALEFLLKSLGNPNYWFFEHKASTSLVTRLTSAIHTGFADNKNVVPIYIGDDHTDEDAFKVSIDMDMAIAITVLTFEGL